MEQIVPDGSATNKKKSQIKIITDIKARIMTMGGIFIFAVIIVLSLVLILNFLFPQGNGLQFVIIIILAFIGWGFFLNCISERLKITNENLIFTTLLGRTTIIQIDDILSYKLTDLGTRLDGNRYLFEVEHEGKLKPEQIWLSPCWDYKELKDFCKSLDLVLNQFE